MKSIFHNLLIVKILLLWWREKLILTNFLLQFAIFADNFSIDY